MRGNDVDVHVQARERAHLRQHVVWSFSLRERDDHAVAPRTRARSTPGRRPGRASGPVGDVAPPLLGRRVHETDQVHAVLRVAQELSRDELADLPRPDDHRVLDVRAATPGQRPRGHPARCGERDRERGEHHHPGGLGLLEAGHPGDREHHPRADHHQPADGEPLLHAAAVRAPLVEAIQAGQAGAHEPGRQGRGEEHEPQRERPGAAVHARGDEAREQERQNECERVAHADEAAQGAVPGTHPRGRRRPHDVVGHRRLPRFGPRRRDQLVTHRPAPRGDPRLGTRSGSGRHRCRRSR